MNEWFLITLLNKVNWEIIGSSHATLLSEATFKINSYAKLIRDPPPPPGSQAKSWNIEWHVTGCRVSSTSFTS